MINLESDSIQIGKDGKTIIPFSINLPGTVQIDMFLEETRINASKTINIILPKTKLNPVESSIDNNSKININTPIELISEIDECVIYYTINDPNLNHLKQYNGNIYINENTNIYAISKDDDYEDSDPIIFYYQVLHIFTVLFDPNGGELDILYKTVIEGEKYGHLPIPKKTNSKFDGWFIDLLWNEEITNETLVEISSNITLYAKWKNDSIKKK